MVHFLVFLSMVLWMVHSSHPFPVHHLGRLKNVTAHNEKRELLLCWVVQIMTHSKCAAEEEPFGDAVGISGKSRHPERRSPLAIVSATSRCGSSSQSKQHAKEIASELDLVVVRVFSEFYDHFVMCHITQRNATMENFSSKVNISYIHHEHTRMKSKDAGTFFQVKHKIESQMSLHHEVLHFSQEYAFRRHSRQLSNSISDKKMSDLTQPPELLLPYPSVKANKRILSSGDHSSCNSKLKGDKKESTLHDVHSPFDHIKSLLSSLNFTLSDKDKLIVYREIFLKLENVSVTNFTHILHQFWELNELYHLFSGNHLNVFNSTVCNFFSSYFLPTEFISKKNICMQTFCYLLNNISLFIVSHHNKTDIDPHRQDISRTPIISKEFCNSFHRVEEKNCCAKMVESLQGIYAKCRLSLNPALKSIDDPVLKFVQSSHMDNKKQESMRAVFLDMSVKRHSSQKAVPKHLRHLKRNIGSSIDDFVSASSKGGRTRIRRSLESIQRVALFNDPAFPHQWHLQNLVTPSMDVNVTGIWANNYTGQGVTVAVVDDGVEWRNPDLQANYNYHGSWDLNDDDPDPSPSTKKIANHHGTRCAGEIAAVANNKVCGVGVAYGSQISGVRVLDGVMTDSLEAEAFNKKMDVNDIYSCSWGPDDDGKTVDGPHFMAAKAMKHGVDFGRKGYGSIFVVASGNGGSQHDNCNFDGYANSIYTVTVGAVDENGRMPYYAEECASMLGVTFSSGMKNKRDIVTTDWMYKNAKGCTESHTGTSAAAPLAAGMIALMLSARHCLTWRDVQYILILTAKKVDVDVAHWQKNGAGLSHSHKHGFGLLSAWRMVNAARVWRPVPWMTSFSYTADNVDASIPKGAGNPLRLAHVLREDDIRGYGLSVLESVQVTVWLSHPCRGNLGVKLISPSGTKSVIAAPRPKDNSSAGFQGWTFTTVRNWGESPVGNWTLEVMDKDVHRYGKGKLSKWRLTLFGVPLTPKEFQERRRLVESAMSGQFLSANHTVSCASPPKYGEEPSILSEKTLKILVLASAFCIVMAVYETLEYLLCYGEEKEEKAREMKLARRALRLAHRTMANSPGDVTDPSLSGNAEGAFEGDTAAASLLSRNNLNDGALNNDYDEEDEDDIFDASETQQLLNRSSRHNAEAVLPLGQSPVANGQASVRIFQDVPSGEVIPMSTFSISSVQNNVETAANDRDH